MNNFYWPEAKRASDENIKMFLVKLDPTLVERKTGYSYIQYFGKGSQRYLAYLYVTRSNTGEIILTNGMYWVPYEGWEPLTQDETDILIVKWRLHEA